MSAAAYSALDSEADRPAFQVLSAGTVSLEDRVAELEALVRALIDRPSGRRLKLPRISHMIRQAAEVFGVSPRQINSRCRTVCIAEARHAVQWIAHHHCAVPNAVIARLFRRDEDTIGQCLRTAQDRIDVDPAYRAKVAEVLRRCGLVPL